MRASFQFPARNNRLRDQCNATLLALCDSITHVITIHIISYPCVPQPHIVILEWESSITLKPALLRSNQTERLWYSISMKRPPTTHHLQLFTILTNSFHPPRKRAAAIVIHRKHDHYQTTARRVKMHLLNKETTNHPQILVRRWILSETN